MELKKNYYYRIIRGILICCAIWASLSISYLVAELSTHYSPDYMREDIAYIAKKPRLSNDDYKTLFYQTGLGKTAVDEIIDTYDDPYEELKIYQENFFADIQYDCSPNSIISNEEHIINQNGVFISGTDLAPIHNGYALVTTCSHCYGWRNGHAAIVVDDVQGISLESVVLGSDSVFRNVSHFESFPNFIMLKLKDSSQQELDEIAVMAAEHLIDAPYDLTVGIFKDKNQKQGQVTGTHCSHLVWQAFYFAGYDVDSNGGMIVTPNDIAHSDLFEVVQIYGLDPDDWWP